ncbi:MAG: alpha-hydroxy-acid oxidizing protein [Desulfovibrionaceae bacterium]
MKDIRIAAREHMKGHCRICPLCDGRACAGEVPGMGGLNTGATFRNNISALARVHINMQLIHAIEAPDTSTSFLGQPLRFPLLAAPIGGVAFNMGTALSEEEYALAIVQGSLQAGIIPCTGDGVPDNIHQAGFAAIRAAGGHGIPYIKPWEDPELTQKLDGALATGAKIIGMDIDAAGLITLRKMGRPVSPKNLSALRKIIDHLHTAGAAFILKGVMTPQDALLAAEAGADALVVSNHGGRVLDHCPGTAAVLPAIAAAVRKRLPIVVDGGVRDGVDVLKMLALGADIVSIGRPLAIAAQGGQAAGVQKFLELVHAQFTQAMLMTGCQSVKDIDGRRIFSE